MAVDALTQVQALVTKVATFSSAAFILPGGTPRRGLKLRFLYSAATNVSGANSVIFSVDVSHDGGSTFLTEAQADPIALSTTAQSGELFVPFEVSPTSVVNGVQIKATAIFSGAGSTPTITYQSDITLARP